MFSIKLLYTLAGTSMISLIIVTILNALTYGSIQSLSSPTRTTELAPVALSVISCMAMIMLTFLVHREIHQNIQWPRWKIGILFLTITYFIAATGSTAGTMATTHPTLPSLWIARSIFWGISVFTEGCYCGYLLVICFQPKAETAWPRSYTLSQELKALPESPSPSPSPSVTTPTQTLSDPYPDMNRFDTRRGSLRKYPRRSNRYSGGTLCFEQHKHASFDTTSTASTAPTTPTAPHHDTNDHHNQQQQQLQIPNENDTRPLRGSSSIRSLPSLRIRDQSPQLSLDNLLQSPSPSASSYNLNLNLDSPTASMEALGFSTEDRIHPLFRATSPCPSPTPSPGTRVKASPSAGQTITHKTVTRMRSARSLREHRSGSPFLSEEEKNMALVHAGHVRRSITQYEKRYDLNESPDE
ncbi:hypothetical protein N7478_011408 [Penicillium angulare]|uniref:uncharacterized protein n=1 Tax=Penicillium angulare TaxID=116970 RepID=UPI00253FE58C|nr:uncharacterized protein N7478_011408 [Penicillium angulare]KAJ5263803.1 hypothetical protein N7478_011408 [Penicillium angulare]